MYKHLRYLRVRLQSQRQTFTYLQFLSRVGLNLTQVIHHVFWAGWYSEQATKNLCTDSKGPSTARVRKQSAPRTQSLLFFLKQPKARNWGVCSRSKQTHIFAFALLHDAKLAQHREKKRRSTKQDDFFTKNDGHSTLKRCFSPTIAH